MLPTRHTLFTYAATDVRVQGAPRHAALEHHAGRREVVREVRALVQRPVEDGGQVRHRPARQVVEEIARRETQEMVAERAFSACSPDGAKRPLGDEAVEQRLRATDLRA
jgi:hypothetical protein